MPHEIVYTSAERGLRVGSRGFCTVASSPSIPPALAERLETLSAYRQLYGPGDPQAGLNPVNFSHLLVKAAGQTYHVVSRVCDAGLDYSGRTNKLAHHVALQRGEMPAAGPAALLAQPGFMLEQWSGEARQLPPRNVPAPAPPSPRVCEAWRQAAGDAGWAGVLAQTALSGAKSDAYVIFSPGMEMLPLISEALLLLPEQHRWRVTFSTYFTSLPSGCECRWRCVVAGSQEAIAAGRSQSALVIDLAQNPSAAPDAPLVVAARTGSTPAVREQPVREQTRGPIARPTGAPSQLAGESATRTAPSRGTTTAANELAMPVGTPSPVPPPVARSQPPAIAPRAADAQTNPLESRRLIIAAAACLLLLILSGAAFAFWSHLRQSRNLAIDEAWQLNEQAESVLREIRSADDQLRSAEDGVELWTEQLQEADSALRDNPQLQRTTELIAAAEQKIEEMAADQKEIGARMASLREVKESDSAAIERAQEEAAAIDGQLAELATTVEMVKADVRGISDVIEHLREIDRVAADVEARRLPELLNDAQRQLSAWEPAMVKFQDQFVRAKEDHPDEEVIVALEVTIANIREAVGLVTNRFATLSWNVTSLESSLASARGTAALGVRPDEVNLSARLEQIETTLLDHRSELAAIRKRFNDMPRQPDSVATNGNPPPHSATFESAASGLPPIESSGQPGLAKLVQIGGRVDAATIHLALLGLPPGAVGSFELEEAMPPDGAAETRFWKVVTKDTGYHFASFRLADGALSFSWEEPASALPSAAAALRNCMLTLVAADQRHAVALSRPARGRAMRFDPARQYEQILEFPVLEGETLELKVTASPTAYDVQQGPGPTPRTAEMHLKANTKVKCKLELKGPGEQGDRANSVGLVGRVHMATRGGEQPDPDDWIGREIQRLTTDLNDADARLSTLLRQIDQGKRLDDELKRAVEKLKSQVTSLEQQIDDWKGEKAELKKYFDRLQVEFEVYRVRPDKNVKVLAYVGRER